MYLFCILGELELVFFLHVCLSKELDSLGLELQAFVCCLVPGTPGPLAEQSVLFAAQPSLQPENSYVNVPVD